MSFSIDDINAAILESVEWDFQNAQGMNIGANDYANGTMQDYAQEAIDHARVYTSDILETWTRYGRPEVESMGDYPSIMDAITWAVHESLREDVDTWKILSMFVESHASLLPGDIDPEDTEAAFEFLAEYANSEH